MRWMSLAAGVALVALAAQVRGWEDNDFNGISQVAIVVSSLEEATKFYTDLGGMLVPKLSTDGIFGDSHYYRLFQTEILDVANSGGTKTLEGQGVLDIRDNGAWKLRWNMIMFGNFMLQLMQFVDRNNPNVVWTTPHPDGNGAAFVTLEHLALWGQNSMDLSVVAGELRTKAGPNSGYTKPFVINSNNAVNNRQEQYVQPISSVLQFNGEALVTDGTQSERLELTTTKDPSRQSHLKAFCDNKSPSPMIMNNWKSGRSMLTSWFGLHHLGVVGDNLDQSNKFYTEVMGGKMAFGFSYPPSELAEFQDDLLDAAENSKLASQWGIPDFTNSNLRQHSSFIAFENAYLEPNYFFLTDGSDNPMAGTFLPFRWKSLSPAYTRTVIAGFGVKTGLDLNKVVQKIEQKSASLGMSNVRGNRVVSVTSASQSVPLSDYSKALTTADLEGYDYTLLRGPAQEPLFIVSYSGKALAALKEAMLAYGAKSARFDETNPWKQDGFKSEYCCTNWTMCDTGSSSSGATWAPSIVVITVTIVAAIITSFTKF